MKNNKINFIEYIIPSWAVCPLINADESALNDSDIAKLDEFTKQVVKEHGNALFCLGDIDGNDNLGFITSNDIDNLGSDCYALYIQSNK